MKSNLNIIFLIAVIVITGLAVLEILRPYLVVLVLAFIFSQFFKGWYKRITKLVGKNKGLGAIITCVLIMLLLIVPLVLVTKMIINEAAELYFLLQSRDLEAAVYALMDHPLLRSSGIDLKATLQSQEFLSSLQNVGNLLVKALKSTYQGAAHFLFMAFVLFFALYYFFKDGDKLMEKLMDISPLKSRQEKMLLAEFIATSRATLKGSLVIAIIQGTITGIILAIAGVPSAAFLGLVATIFAFFPLVGSGVVWLPAGVILILLGDVIAGAMVIASGALIVGTIDNLLRPRLVGNETSLHPLLVFLSTLGGLAVYGIAGFILGPIVVALFLSLLQIYQMEFKKELKKFNQ